MTRIRPSASFALPCLNMSFCCVHPTRAIKPLISANLLDRDFNRLSSPLRLIGEARKVRKLISGDKRGLAVKKVLGRLWWRLRRAGLSAVNGLERLSWARGISRIERMVHSSLRAQRDNRIHLRR